MLNKRMLLKTATLVLSITFLSPGIQAKSCLWKATSKKGMLYIQGSVHLLKSNDYPLPPAIETAYTDSDILILEADMKAMLDPETQKMIMAKALLKGDQTLESILQPEVYAQLSTKLADAGLPSPVIQKFKPWFATMTLMLTKMQAMGFDPKLGLDQYFYGKAVSDQKPVVGLETVKFQIDLFDALAESNQNDYTKRALDELGLIETILDQLMLAWKKGDIEGLGKLMLKSFEDYPDLHERFVIERNKNWIKIINSRASKKKTHMIVVGAAHLPGKEGLLELLKEKGYALEQL